jgi:hypothetical protein
VVTEAFIDKMIGWYIDWLNRETAEAAASAKRS